jgi:hypothetical protein
MSRSISGINIYAWMESCGHDVTHIISFAWEGHVISSLRTHLGMQIRRGGGGGMCLRDTGEAGAQIMCETPHG